MHVLVFFYWIIIIIDYLFSSEITYRGVKVLIISTLKQIRLNETMVKSGA